MPGENEIKEILQKVSNYCIRGEKCELDIRKYLRSYDLNSEEIQYIINKLISESFINEDRYAKAFINDKFKFNKWGKIKIINELKARNVNTGIIIKHINEIDKEDYLKTLERLLIIKLNQVGNKDKQNRKAALIRYGLSRGFEYEYIEKVLDRICEDE